jgi:hypothetical protein
MPATTARVRGRPRGRRDQRARHRSPRKAINLLQCKADLLLLLLCTRDELGDWRAVDMALRHLFALTHSFGDWLAAGRRLDSLALQMRRWVHRDLLPLAEATRLFTRPVPSALAAKRYHFVQALRLIKVLNAPASTTALRLLFDVERYADDADYRAECALEGARRWSQARLIHASLSAFDDI